MFILLTCTLSKVGLLFKLISKALIFQKNTKLITKYYKIRVCEDKKHRIVINNVTYQLDSFGSTVVSAVVDFLPPAINDFSKVSGKSQ